MSAPLQADRRAGVAAASYFLPGDAQDIVQWAPPQGIEPDLIDRLLKNGCRHFHESSMHSDVDLICEAIGRIDAPAGWLADVRYLLHANTQSISAPPAPASVLAQLLLRQPSLRPTLAYSVGQLQCGSIVSAIEQAARLLEADREARYALVVTSDRVFGDASFRIRSDTGIQSDGGCAVLLSCEDVLCWVGETSLRYVTRLHDGHHIAKNVQTLNLYAWRHIRDTILAHGQTTGRTIESYGNIFTSNSDVQYWINVAKALGVSASKFYLDNTGLRGNACCANYAVNLVDQGLACLAGGAPVMMVTQSNVGVYSAQTLLPLTEREQATC